MNIINININHIINIKMNHYWFNRQEILQKAKENTQKKKLLSIINKTKRLQKKSQESVIKTCPKKKKTRLKRIKEKISRIGSI